MSYLNTKPLIYGLSRHPVRDDIELVTDYPSRVAAMLLDGSIDVGLVPVAILPELRESHIITPYCIGCDGAVDSVAIFSELPLNQVNTIWLDYQSRTSVMLTRILMQEYWKKEVNWVDAKDEEYLHRIGGDVAGVVIGDRALEQKKVSAYMYDLGLAWKQHTGLPFVFAAWVANRQLPETFVQAFSEANAIGLNDLNSVLAQETHDRDMLRNYYTQRISYDLTPEKRKGLDLFLSKIRAFSTKAWPHSPEGSSGWPR